MARVRRKRRRGRARPPQGDPSATELTALGHREDPVAERPFKKTYHSSDSTSSTLCEPHVWSGLLDSLLHQVIALLSSFQDLLAFSGTCHSWRAAVSSFPSIYTFTFPPLHLKPHDSNLHSLCSNFKDILLTSCKWQLGDPSKRNLSLREILQIACTIWVALMGISSSRIMRTASLLMCTLALRWSLPNSNPRATRKSTMASSQLHSIHPTRVSCFVRDPRYSIGRLEQTLGQSTPFAVSAFFRLCSSKPSEDSDEPWTTVELGQSVLRTVRCFPYGHRLLQTNGHGSQLENLWVLPRFVYGADQ
ncbi:uncharacterized protein LOC102719126 [Oryza brachyantha]|uniref:uncharacterized protein LOC102719126 n=1 Tax=Oryza brachyantha TaxID=4533 RepID=UPI000776A31A|nr:uncharacterized protein LOC102719126 [Oryza brachyantha]